LAIIGQHGLETNETDRRVVRVPRDPAVLRPARCLDAVSFAPEAQFMLETLRRGATSKIAAIIIFVPLILAFSLWGVGPESIRQTGGNTIAKIGTTEVSPDQFQAAYQQELNQLSQMFGRRITQEEARSLGSDQRVLSRLLGAAALDTQAGQLGLTLPNTSIADGLRADPNFAGPDGKFSKPSFDQFLRQNNLTEAGYLAIRRKEDVREQVTEALLASVTVPQSYIDLTHRHQEETRIVEFMVLDTDKAVKVADPDEATLKAYHETNKKTFMTPAYRKISLLLMTNALVKGRAQVSDEDVKAAYEETKATFNTPETRRLQQFAFPDKASADKAYAEMVKTKVFVEAAAKLGLKETDADLGVVKMTDLIDPKIAAAAFALKKDEVSKPVEGQFTTVILRVTEITPGITNTFENVRALVKDKLAAERAGRELQGLRDKVEDERTAGRTLKEVGEKLGLQFQAFDAVDKAGNGPDGKPVGTIPDLAKVMAAVFGGAQGVEADAVDLADGGNAWLDVLGQTPEAEKTYEAVKEEAKLRWLETEKSKALAETAAKLVERMIKGETIAAVAKDAGVKAETSASFKRTAPPPGLTPDAVRQAFGLPKGVASSSASPDGRSRTVFRIATVTPAAAPTKEQSDAIRTAMLRGMQTDTLTAYVGGLQTRYGVTINETVLRQSMGLDRQPR
jgi:peptidyl-prolyl cis-trans isomerase D